MPRNRAAARATALVGLALLTTQVVATGVGSAAPAPASSAARTTDATACKRPAHGFVPSQAQIPAIGRTVQVIQVQRTSSGAVGAGPTTESGKWLMSMDPQTKPGSHKGSVLLSGHTWPDGSALGNAMLSNLQVGDGIVLVGKNGKQACYRINKRQSYPVDKVPTRKAFRQTGPEQVVIVACSGKRTSPGHWTRRTLWYATPLLPAPPAPPPTSPPPSTPPNGGLLGGLLGGL